MCSFGGARRCGQKRGKQQTIECDGKAAQVVTQLPRSPCSAARVGGGFDAPPGSTIRAAVTAIPRGRTTLDSGMRLDCNIVEPGHGCPSSWAMPANSELCCPEPSWLAPSGRWARARPAGGTRSIRQASPSRPGRATPRFGWILLRLGGKAPLAMRRCGHRKAVSLLPPSSRNVRIERSPRGHRPAAPHRNPNPCRARTKHRFARRAPRSIGGRLAAPVRSPRPGW